MNIEQIYLDKSLTEAKENVAFYYDFNAESYYIKDKKTNNKWEKEKFTSIETQSNLIHSFKNTIEQLKRKY